MLTACLSQQQHEDFRMWPAIAHCTFLSAAHQPAPISQVLLSLDGLPSFHLTFPVLSLHRSYKQTTGHNWDFKALIPELGDYRQGCWSMSFFSGPPKGGGTARSQGHRKTGMLGVLHIPVTQDCPHQLLQLFQKIQMPQETTKRPQSTALHFKQHCKLTSSHLNWTDWIRIG